MLLIGGWLMFSAPRVWADGTPTPEAMHMDMDGTPEADHDHGDRIPAGDAAIRIVSPADGALLTDNSAIVKVETTNWPLGEGKHWHLYVNGQEQGMSQGSSPSLQARDLMAGANTLEAVMSNELHQELDAVAKVVVLVEIARMAAPGNVLPIVIGFAVALMAIGGAAVMLVRKK
jgi:hypothetical protein